MPEKKVHKQVIPKNIPKKSPLREQYGNRSKQSPSDSGGRNRIPPTDERTVDDGA